MGFINDFRTHNNFLVKYFFYIFIVLLVFGTWGCAHNYRKTGLLIEAQPTLQKDSNISFVFLDERDERFKAEKGFLVQYVLPTLTWGDPVYDSSLFKVFQEMVMRRFGDNPQGNKAELKLKAWHYTVNPHEIFTFPIIGPMLAAHAKFEFHGVLKAEISILDRDEKYIFHKVYDVDLREMKSRHRDTSLPPNLDMLNKAFDKFANEFNQDINRIRFK